MATITITGTPDQFRRLSKTIQYAASAAEGSPNPKAATITLDTGVSNTIASVTDSSGKRKDT